MAWFVFDAIKFAEFELWDPDERPERYSLYRHKPDVVTVLINCLWAAKQTNDQPLRLSVFDEDGLQPALYAIFGGVFVGPLLITCVPPEIAEDHDLSLKHDVDDDAVARVAFALSDWLDARERDRADWEQREFERHASNEAFYFNDLNDGETPQSAGSRYRFDVSDVHNPMPIDEASSATRPTRAALLEEMRAVTLQALEGSSSHRDAADFPIPGDALSLRRQCAEMTESTFSVRPSSFGSALFGWAVAPTIGEHPVESDSFGSFGDPGGSNDWEVPNGTEPF